MSDTACSPTLEREQDTDDSLATSVSSVTARRIAGRLGNRAYFRYKYRFDRVAGSVLLIVFSLPILVLAALVKLTSRGSAFYLQERVGLNGETFKIIKLRSMVKNAEKDGQAVWCVKNDARVTPLGKILRKLHLDELPQLVNVALGQMSLVGPRPERPEICEELAKQIDGYYNRVAVKPGVTGLAQINLPPDELIEDAIRKQILDLRYIDEANAWLDIRMLFATGLRMVGIRGETVMSWMRVSRRELVQKLTPCIDTNEQDAASTVLRPSEWDDTDSHEQSLVFSLSVGGDVSRSAESSATPRHPR